MRQSRCIAYAIAFNGDPRDLIAGYPKDTDPVLRWGHMDFNRLNARSLHDGTWKRIVTVQPFHSFSYVLSRVGNYPGPQDPCGWVTTGPHLHMDSPSWALRNCTLAADSTVSHTTTGWEFGARSEHALTAQVRYLGENVTTVAFATDARYEFSPDDRVLRLPREDANALVDSSLFELVEEKSSDGGARAGGCGCAEKPGCG